ncbi:GntR family transcriptional regulator [Cribrihabitans sp. XS_ASV171]
MDSARDRFDRLHATLRDRICMLDYAPGLRLSEAELASEFGTSRTPLRRVLGRLEGEGLVQSVQGVGTFVTDVTLAELDQTYELRMELAGLVGHLSPQKPDEGTMERLRAGAAAAKALAITPEPRAFARLNMDFFMLRLILTANEPLRETAERLYIRTARIWLKSVFAQRLDLREEVRAFEAETRDVVDALAIGDLEAAALIQRAHISMSYRRMRG